MKTKGVLEYILFFVINLCTIQLSLANYTKMEDKEFGRLVIPAKHVLSVVPCVFSSAGMPDQMSSNVIMVVRTDEGVVSQTFNSEEEVQLERLVAKVGEADFGKLMVQYCKDKAGLMEIARAGPMGNEIASRK